MWKSYGLILVASTRNIREDTTNMYDNRYFLPRVPSPEPRHLVERDQAREARRSLSRTFERRQAAQPAGAR